MSDNVVLRYDEEREDRVGGLHEPLRRRLKRGAANERFHRSLITGQCGVGRIVEREVLALVRARVLSEAQAHLADPQRELVGLFDDLRNALRENRGLLDAAREDQHEHQTQDEKDQRHDGERNDLTANPEHRAALHLKFSWKLTCSVVGPTLLPAMAPNLPLIKPTGTPPSSAA